MKGTWQCGVCETVNDSDRTCAACGADLTRRSTITTSVRNRLTPALPPPNVAAPLPEPVKRAINREPVSEEEWVEYETGYGIRPIPGGCLINLGPRPIRR